MSEMIRNKGIIREVYPGFSVELAIDKLIADGKLSEDDVEKDDGEVKYIDSDDYEMVDGRLFDVSGAPDMYDDSDDVNEATRLNDTEYRVHAYYYNGGTHFGEMLGESIPKADAEYEGKGSLVTYYAIKRANGGFVTGAGNSSLTTPRLYLTEANAHKAVKRHMPGVAENYTIVKFQEV